MGTPARGDSPPGIESIVELASVWYWESDAQHRFTSMITPAREHGWPLADAVGRPRWELPGAAPLSGGWGEHRATLDAHRPFRDFQFMLPHPDLGQRCISVAGVPLFGPDGHFTGYRGVSRDVTDEWHARQRLRETEALLGLAAKLSRLRAWSIDVDARRLTWSEEVGADGRPAAWKTYGPEFLDFYTPDSREMLTAAYEECVAHGTPYQLEAQAQVRGEPRWIRVTGVPARDANGRVTRVQGAFQDITAGKQATERYRALAARLANTLESLPFGFGAIDRDWRITFANSAAEQILRRPRDEMVGRSLWDAFPGMEESVFGRAYRRVMRERVIEEFEGYVDPLQLWASVRAFPSEDGIAITFTDVTRAWQAQQEIARLNAELEQRVAQRTGQLEAAFKDLEAFTYTVAHDLRAPLAAITGYGRALGSSQEQRLGPRSRHYLDRIQAATQRLDRMTEAILSLAKLNRVQPRRRPVDLAELARHCVAMLREAQPQRRVECRLPSTLPAEGDPALLHVVMSNLLANAWKYTSHCVQATIEVGRRHEGGEIVYFVRDNGVGFDPAEASRLFEPFSRIHGPEFEGTGIGLATVHRLVTRHGGRVWAQAAPEAGATFFFTLPPAAA